ncbi:MAG: hypothetical protein JSS83_28775 [Cyanobacteria bacterium SZAS LIN-3]|nr:hypothetical protein [Cyanobacteria bacterium SZAS LIN-3]
MKRRHLMEADSSHHEQLQLQESGADAAVTPDVGRVRRKKGAAPTRRNPSRKAKQAQSLEQAPPSEELGPEVLAPEPASSNAKPATAEPTGVEVATEPVAAVQVEAAESELRSTSRSAGATLHELKQVASQRQLQTAKAVCPFIRESLAVLPSSYQRSVALLVIGIATDITLSNRRKRVMVRDVEPLVQLVKALSKLSA